MVSDENLPLSKYDSLTSFLKEVNLPGLDLVCNDNRIKYQSYYTANELLDALNFVADCELNRKCRESPYISILADESTDISNTQRMTITARVIVSYICCNTFGTQCYCILKCIGLNRDLQTCINYEFKLFLF